MESTKLDAILLQEMMGCAQEVKFAQGALLVWWCIEASNARGLSSGLSLGWNVRSYRCEIVGVLSRDWVWISLWRIWCILWH